MPDELQNNISGTILKGLRLSKGLTQIQLGNKVNVSRSSISNYETGIRAMDNQKLKLFADFFGVDVNYLLGENTTLEISQFLHSKIRTSKYIVKEHYLDISLLTSISQTVLLHFFETLLIQDFRRKRELQEKQG